MSTDIPVAKKRLAQHWLLDAKALRAVVAMAPLSPKDTMLEIGPGLGSLTALLIKRAAAVWAVEIDNQLAGSLAQRIGADERLKVINQDILSFDLRQLPTDYRVVANIPYNLSGQIIRLLLDSINPPLSLTLLLQEEVAQRIAAQPGRLSVLAVACQLWGAVSLGPRIEAAKFTPPPKVDSRVITLVRYSPARDKLLLKRCLRTVRLGFANRRKTLENSLSAGLSVSKYQLRPMLLESGLSNDSRAQELSLQQWLDLTDILTASGYL